MARAMMTNQFPPNFDETAGRRVTIRVGRTRATFGAIVAGLIAVAFAVWPSVVRAESCGVRVPDPNGELCPFGGTACVGVCGSERVDCFHTNTHRDCCVDQCRLDRTSAPPKYVWHDRRRGEGGNRNETKECRSECRPNRKWIAIPTRGLSPHRYQEGPENVFMVFDESKETFVLVFLTAKTVESPEQRVVVWEYDRQMSDWRPASSGGGLGSLPKGTDIAATWDPRNERLVMYLSRPNDSRLNEEGDEYFKECSVEMWALDNDGETWRRVASSIDPSGYRQGCGAKVEATLIYREPANTFVVWFADSFREPIQFDPETKEFSKNENWSGTGTSSDHASAYLPELDRLVKKPGVEPTKCRCLGRSGVSNTYDSKVGTTNGFAVVNFSSNHIYESFANYTHGSLAIEHAPNGRDALFLTSRFDEFGGIRCDYNLGCSGSGEACDYDRCLGACQGETVWEWRPQTNSDRKPGKDNETTPAVPCNQGYGRDLIGKNMFGGRWRSGHGGVRGIVASAPVPSRDLVAFFDRGFRHDEDKDKLGVLWLYRWDAPKPVSDSQGVSPPPEKRRVGMANSDAGGDVGTSGSDVQGPSDTNRSVDDAEGLGADTVDEVVVGSGGTGGSACSTPGNSRPLGFWLLLAFGLIGNGLSRRWTKSSLSSLLARACVALGLAAGSIGCTGGGGDSSLSGSTADGGIVDNIASGKRTNSTERSNAENPSLVGRAASGGGNGNVGGNGTADAVDDSPPRGDTGTQKGDTGSVRDTRTDNDASPEVGGSGDETGGTDNGESGDPDEWKEKK